MKHQSINVMKKDKRRKSSYYEIERILICLILLFTLSIKSISAQGPNAPEAAAFEPVDATDMVNLLTGDFSYVLPLLNVPSPEGGYPLSLSYHGGIAHNQEASWVGLGWNLNPGSINRNINGLPDDWGKTKYEEFFYDAGWTEDEYNFSIGATIYNTVSVGIGASWGSHRSTGGFVSLGYGYEGIGGNVTIGTDGAGIGFGYHGFNASISTNGVGIGYSQSLVNSGGSNKSLGINLNYNYNSGLSGGFSLSRSTKTGEKIKSQSVGMDFSANGPSVNAAINRGGLGISTSNFGISSGDYNIEVDGFQTSIPLYIFYVGFGHKRVTYSLYKKNNLTTSGSVYPYHANETKPFTDGTGPSYLMKENYFMDVNEFPAFSHKSMSLDYLVEQDYKIDKNNISLPGYDYYTVTSQGLSGNIKPASYRELNLADRGKAETNNDNIYTAYVADNFDSYLDKVNDLGGTTHFYFENELSSFLRIDRSNIFKESFVNNATDQTLLNGFKTANTSTYNQEFSPNGDRLTWNNRKRSGNYIETFTNKQIRDNNINGFIEAKNINRNNEKDTFLDEGIGAFRITALDGKTYHYSLPVYNFEVFYKNFKNASNEDQNFFEIKKTKPYATHWLLTAVTGPDYVDINSDGVVNKGDYGYWVEFDYGKWTDGYVWRGPVDGYEEHTNAEDPSDKTYSYYWGRKQIYYLDAITTRSHTALFVKDLRADNTSNQLSIYKKRYTAGTFNVSEYSKVIKSGENKFRSSIIGEPGDQVYKDNGSIYTFTDSPYFPFYANHIEVYKGKKTTSKYFDIPKNKVLKLSKIILLKNDNVQINKNRNTLTQKLTAYSSINTGFTDIHRCNYDVVQEVSQQCEETPINGISNAYLEPIILKSFTIHQHDKVLDIKDIEGLNLEQNADQIINFNYDYSLAQQSPNSISPNKGRLTLKSVNFNGKKGSSLIPPYTFGYDLISTPYEKENQDEWGYHKTNPQAWSLNKITTPTGGEIKIQHEADSYYSEAAYTETKAFDNIKISKLRNSDVVTVEFADSSINLLEYFQTGITTDFTISRSDSFDALEPYTYEDKIFNVKIKQIDNLNKRVMFQRIQNETFPFPNNESFSNLSMNTNNDCVWLPFITSTGREDWEITHCYKNGNIKSTKGPTLDFTQNNSNGKLGGGIRVASIEVKGESSAIKTVYDYTNLEDNNISGITSYAPSKEQKGIPYVSELPAPLVTYGNVTMKNYDGYNNFLGSTSYEFDVLKPYEENQDYIFCLGDFFKVKEQQDENFFEGKVKAKKYTIYNKVSDIGRLKSVASYNSNDQLLNRTKNNYKSDLDNDGQIGVSQQSYKSIKKLKKDNAISFLITSTSKVDYPSIIESKTDTQGGFTNTTYYDEYDFLTGQITQTRAILSDGSEYKTKVIPAYKIDAYTNNISGYSMGAKVDNPTNKNMLTQTALELTQIKDDTGHWDTTSSSISTWNNEWTYHNNDGTTSTPSNSGQKIWRKHKTFVWKGALDPNGAYAGYAGDDDGFNWSNTDNQSNTKWINTSTVNLYDHYSMPLETRDINGNKTSTKMGDDHSKVFAVANAGYKEMFYSGAEDLIEGTHYFSGQVYKGNTAILSDIYHTGTKSVQAGANVKAFAVNPKAGNYKISIWVYKGVNNNYVNTKVKAANTVISYHPQEIILAGDWVQLNFYINSIADSQEVYVYNTSGTAIYDDFRMLPMTSSMTSYVYNEWDELTYVIAANNLATKYEYDNAGRLHKTYTEVIDAPEIKGGFKLNSEINYNYSKPASTSTTNPNALTLSIGVNNPNISSPTLTARANGGTFEYEYRWAINNNQNNLNYGSWSSSNTRNIFTSCLATGRVYYKCQVRDKNTGAIKESTGSHQKQGCGDNDDNPNDPDGNPIQQ
ncbi:hypothetical protein [Tenacibaculum sp. 190524A05c]|uniref:hypothetical protein n=1 Tax=Tenacibaculum platacis TaxID=3137852 RepID=UPI0031FA6F0C